VVFAPGSNPDINQVNVQNRVSQGGTIKKCVNEEGGVAFRLEA
jgi:hypothetical protein